MSNILASLLGATPVLNNHDYCSKLSTNSKQYAIAQRLLKSYFVSLHSLLSSVSSQSDIPSYAVTESANLVPWIVGNRKIARGWVKMLLGVYDSASDEVRVQAFAALRKLAIAADHSLRESIMKASRPSPNHRSALAVY